jgi:hypothetical protein
VQAGWLSSADGLGVAQTALIAVMPVVVSAHGVNVVPSTMRGTVAADVVAALVAIVVVAVRLGGAYAQGECGDSRQD